MKRFLFLMLVIPAFANAQVKKIKSKTASKTVVKNTAADKTSASTKVADGFLITANVAGITDGSTIKMLNGSSGAEEQTTTVQKGKFSFTGKTINPDFKLFGINGQPPFITIFLDNSNVAVNAKAGAFETAEITGSPSHTDFTAFNIATAKYQDLFNGKGRYEVDFMNEAAAAVEKFVSTHPASFISPLAIYRHNQVTGDFAKQEQMFSTLTEPIKVSQIGIYIAQQIAQNNAAGYGKPLADFSQADTSGKEITLASFKGKYVLVDFWASWCGPCRAENPNVVRTFETYKNKNFTVLGISLDRDKQKWVEAIATDGLAWTHLSDLKFWSNAVAQQFGIQSIPQNFLIDPQGNLIAKNLRGAALDYKLMQVIK